MRRGVLRVGRTFRRPRAQVGRVIRLSMAVLLSTGFLSACVNEHRLRVDQAKQLRLQCERVQIPKSSIQRTVSTDLNRYRVDLRRDNPRASMIVAPCPP